MKLSAFLFPILLTPALQAIEMPPMPKGVPFMGNPHEQQPQGVPIVQPSLALFPVPNATSLIFLLDKINDMDVKSAEKFLDAAIVFAKENQLTLTSEEFAEIEGYVRLFKIQESDSSAKKAQLEFLKKVNSNDVILKHYFGDKAEIVKKMALETITKTETDIDVVEKKQAIAQIKLSTFADYALNKMQEEGLVKEDNSKTI